MVLEDASVTEELDEGASDAAMRRGLSELLELLCARHGVAATDAIAIMAPMAMDGTNLFLLIIGLTFLLN